MIFTGKWLCYVRVFAIANPSCRLSVVCNVRVLYSGVETFGNISSLVCTLPLTFAQNFTEIIPQPLRRGVRRKRDSKIELSAMSRSGISYPDQFLVILTQKWKVHGRIIKGKQVCPSKVIWEEGRVAVLSHTYAVKYPLVTMARPKFTPKVPLPMDRSPNPTTCLIRGPVRPMIPNGIRIRSAVFPQCTGQTDRPTHRRTDAETDRSSTGKFDDYRLLRYESDAAEW